MAFLGHCFTHTPQATHRSRSFCALYLLAMSLRFLGQQVFEKFRRVGHTHLAFAQHLASACAFQKLALGGAVALLEFFHYLAHSPSRLGFVFGEKAINDAGSDECSASAFHIAHSHGETVACVFYSLFVKPCEVVVCATHSLRAIVCAACFFC